MEETKQPLRYKRTFIGKTENFESKEDRNFHKANLKAYLKGRKVFAHGFVTDKFNNRHPEYHIPSQLWEKVPLENPTSRAAKRFAAKNPYLIAA